ncbi:MAG: DUF4012 domain-containing protein [Anaerolineae bacterium]|nr:DUF4012 domain-containing protein [Anaerolineae bacterium]
MSLKGLKKRWIVAGIALVVILVIGIWAARVYGTVRSLVGRLPEAQALLEGNPLEADPAAVGALVRGVRADVTALKRQAGWLAPLGPLFRWVPKVGPVLGEVPELLVLGDSLLDVGVVFWDDAALLMTLVQADVPPTEALAVALPYFVEDVPQVQPLLAQAQAAYQDLDVAGFPERLGQPLALLGKGLPLLNDGLATVESLPWLLGMDAERTYLLLVLNEDELRAGGGFISGVGELHIKGGKLSGMTFTDSYKADDFSFPYPDPPEWLRSYMGIDLLVFRDSNWSPDFPSAARQAIELYHPKHAVEVDGVFAVDQRAAQQLVDALGPLAVEGSDEPVTGASLLDYVYHSWAPEDGELSGEWWMQRKAFMGKLAQAAMARLSSGQVDFKGLAKAGLAMIEQKHLLMYFDDESLETFLHTQGWDGGIPDPVGDTVMVVESNVGYNKASSKIERAYTYLVDLTTPAPAANVTLAYTHTSTVDIACKYESRYDVKYVQMQDRCYWAHLRLYAPAGVQLQASSRHPIPGTQLASGNPWPGEAQPSDAPEGPWTVFSQAFLMPTAAHTEVTFTYFLPVTVVQESAAGVFTYHLDWVKQPGIRPVPVRVILLLPQNAVLLTAMPNKESCTTLHDQSAIYPENTPSVDQAEQLCEIEHVLDKDWALTVQYRLSSKDGEP